ERPLARDATAEMDLRWTGRPNRVPLRALMNVPARREPLPCLDGRLQWLRPSVASHGTSACDCWAADRPERESPSPAFSALDRIATARESACLAGGGGTSNGGSYICFSNQEVGQCR